MSSTIISSKFSLSWSKSFKIKSIFFSISLFFSTNVSVFSSIFYKNFFIEFLPLTLSKLSFISFMAFSKFSILYFCLSVLFYDSFSSVSNSFFFSKNFKFFLNSLSSSLFSKYCLALCWFSFRNILYKNYKQLTYITSSLLS